MCICVCHESQRQYALLQRSQELIWNAIMVTKVEMPSGTIQGNVQWSRFIAISFLILEDSCLTETEPKLQDRLDSKDLLFKLFANLYLYQYASIFEC